MAVTGGWGAGWAGGCVLEGASGHLVSPGPSWGVGTVIGGWWAHALDVARRRSKPVSGSSSTCQQGAGRYSRTCATYLQGLPPARGLPLRCPPIPRFRTPYIARSSGGDIRRGRGCLNTAVPQKLPFLRVPASHIARWRGGGQRGGEGSVVMAGSVLFAPRWELLGWCKCQ